MRDVGKKIGLKKINVLHLHIADCDVVLHGGIIDPQNQVREDPPVTEITTMKKLFVLTAAIITLVNAVGCNCLRGRGAPCAPVCMPAAQCAPAVSYSDCAPAATYGGGTIVEPYGSPTPATTVTPGPATTFTPSN